MIETNVQKNLGGIQMPTSRREMKATLSISFYSYKKRISLKGNKELAVLEERLEEVERENGRKDGERRRKKMEKGKGIEQEGEGRGKEKGKGKAAKNRFSWC